jgi:hypothetical protein
MAGGSAAVGPLVELGESAGTPGLSDEPADPLIELVALPVELVETKGTTPISTTVPSSPLCSG